MLLLKCEKEKKITIYHRGVFALCILSHRNMWSWYEIDLLRTHFMNTYFLVLCFYCIDDMMDLYWKERSLIHLMCKQHKRTISSAKCLSYPNAHHALFKLTLKTKHNVSMTGGRSFILHSINMIGFRSMI